MDTQSIKEENAALGRILTGDFYRIVWNITTPSYFSRKEANYSVHFSVIWKFFLLVSSRISTLYHVYQRLPLIVEEFDFKFLIEITLTLSFFFRWQRFTEWREIQILRILGRSICITFAAVSFPNDRVSNTLSSLFENTTRDTMYTQWSHLRGTLACSNIQVRSQELVGDVPPSRLHSKNYFARDWK